MLNVAGRPLIDYIFDKIVEVEDIQQTIISTNQRFEQQFRGWLDSYRRSSVRIIPDRSRSEEEKPGAVASLAQITSGIDDDCLIIAGDNLFTCSLRPMIQTFKSRKAPVVALRDVKNPELVKQYSTAIIDSEGRIIRLIEKPTQPETTLIGTCIYVLPKRTLPRLREYVAKASDRDTPGRFIEWLHKLEPIYGHILNGYWWDIGTLEQYVTADQVLTSLLRG